MKIMPKHLLVGLALIPALASADMPHYHITALPVSEFQEARARDLNERGQVTGSIAPSTGGRTFSLPFLYTDGQVLTIDAPADEGFGFELNELGDIVGVLTFLPFFQHGFLYSQGVLTDLNSLTGGQRSGTSGINNARQIIGSFSTEPFTPTVSSAFVYNHRTGTFRDLGAEFFAGKDSGASDINAKGQIAGAYQQPGNRSTSRAFLFDPKTNRAIDLVPGRESYTAGRGSLNQKGHVAGTFVAADGLFHGFIHRDGRVIDIGAVQTTVGLAGGGVAAINNVDEVTGYLGRGDDRVAFIYKRGKIRKLSTPEQAGVSVGEALNDWGEVVGTADFMPFVYSRGKFQKLDIGRLGGEFGEGVDINNSGQIVGNYGIQHPQVGIQGKVFLATPITLLFSNLLHQVRRSDFRLSSQVAWAWFLYETEAHRPTCLALTRLSTKLPAGLTMKANTIREALECAALN